VKSEYLIGISGPVFILTEVKTSEISKDVLKPDKLPTAFTILVVKEGCLFQINQYSDHLKWRT
jgi:hypothetical protein